MQDATKLVTNHPGTTAHMADPKWAAIVNDRLVPLPRQRLRTRDILTQSGHPGGVLLRDYNQPADVPLEPDELIDLAEGNVFRVVPSCEAPTVPPLRETAKLAFVMDDAWEVTIQPVQTPASLRGLFGLPDDAVILRDFESPHDERFHDGATIKFTDGPVFRSEITRLTVKVNRHPVVFTKRRATGLEIKQNAIAQKVDIKLDFLLHQRLPNGEFGPAIRDDQIVSLRECDEFRCVAPDDNS